MNYEANTGIKYFTPAEEKHLKEFFDNEPKLGFVLENEKGEKRKPVKVAYPVGVITNLTTYGRRPEPRFNGEVVPDVRPYHTPCATVTDSKEAIVSYIDIVTGEWYNIGSKEWLKWALSGKMKVTEPPPDPVNPLAKLAPDKLNNIMGVTNLDESKLDDFSKGAKWTAAKKKTI